MGYNFIVVIDTSTADYHGSFENNVCSNYTEVILDDTTTYTAQEWDYSILNQNWGEHKVEYVIPQSSAVTSIGDYSFAEGINMIKSITIPTSVTNIGTSPFRYVNALYFCSTTPPTANADSFNSFWGTLYVPTGTVSTYQNATNYPSPLDLTYVEWNPPSDMPTTLNGALELLGETMAENLTTMGLIGVSASDGLTTLAGKILQISGGGGSTTIFEDDATNNNRDTLFGASSISLRNSGTSTMTWNSASPSYYQVQVTNSSSDSFIEFLPLQGVTDSFKLTMKYKLPSTNSVSYVGLYYYIDDNNWGGVKGLNDAQWVSDKTNGTFSEQEYRTGQSNTTDYYTHEIIYNKTANTLAISTYDSSDNLIQSKTMNIPITLTSSVKWGNAVAWSNGDKNNIYYLKAEYLGTPSSDCSQYTTQINNAIEYINGSGT